MNANTVRRGITIAVLCATAALGLVACDDSGDTSAKAMSGGAGSGSSPSAAPKPTTPTPTPPALAQLSADEIVHKATDAMTSTRSLTADMTGEEDGKPTTFHLSLDSEGECTGHLTEGSANVEIISTRTHFYMRGNDAFLKQMGDGTVQLLHGKWMKTAATSSTAKEMSSFCDLDELLSGFKEKAHRPTKGALSTLDGRRVIPVSDKDPKDGSTSTAYIAADDTPHVLKIVTVGGDEAGTLLFGDFDKPVSATAPPAGQVVDIDKLGS